MYMLMAVMALVLVVPTWWAMRVRQMQGGAAGHVKAAAFALFQLAVMAALIAADAWWATLLYVFLMLATGNMVLEAVTQRYPASRVGAWWARQKAAAASSRT